MMEVLSLSRAKEILRIEDDYKDEDNHLKILCQQSVSLFEKMTLQKIDDLKVDGVIPPSTMVTIEFILVYLYNNATSGEDINRLMNVIKTLIQLDRSYS